MKTKILILTVAVLFGFQNIFAQSEKEISSIRSQVNTIDKNLRKYKKKTKDVYDLSTEGAEAVYYSSGKNLKKVAAKIYGETFNASGEFYYQGEELIFAYFKLNRYDTQIGLKKPVKVVKVEEKRLYLAGGDLIKLLIGKRQIKSGDKKFTESKDEIIETSRKLKGAYD